MKKTSSDFLRVRKIICFFFRIVVFFTPSGIRRKLHQMNFGCHCLPHSERAGDDMEIGMIGAGKVGCSMGKYMIEHGFKVAGYVSRHRESSEQAGTFTGTKVFEDLYELIQACGLLCLAVPDDEIGNVWQQMRGMGENGSAVHPLAGKIVCHFSGSLSSAVFSGIEGTGAAGCSVHPMYAFSDKFTSYQKLNSAIVTIEGHERAAAVMEDMFSHMGNRVLKISPEAKMRYHCSASLVSNFMTGLFSMGLDLLEQCGIPEETGRELVGPLVVHNIEAAVRDGAEKTLTGPIERGDVHTVEGHLAVLRGEERMIYQLLGQKVLAVARRKNPDRDYRNISELLQ